MVGRITILPCMKCCEDAINNGDVPDLSMYEMLTSDNGVVFFQCKNGHKNTVIIQEQSFEILLEMAIDNIIDKYYREAVFNFAAAQERCFEFFNELVLFEKNVSNGLYANLWKVYRNSSERQLGAFYSLYLMRFGKNFDYDEKQVSLRNDIIHKGKIATKESTFEYGRYVLNNVYNLLESITENILPDTVLNFKLQKIENNISKAKMQKDTNISTAGVSIISWSCMTDEEYEQEQKLACYSKLHSEEYAQKASEANSYGNKKLYINEKNELVIIDAPDIHTEKVGAHYRRRRSLEDLIEDVKKMRKLNTEIKSRQIEKATIVSCLDE